MYPTISPFTLKNLFLIFVEFFKYKILLQQEFTIYIVKMLTVYIQYFL